MRGLSNIPSLFRNDVNSIIQEHESYDIKLIVCMKTFRFCHYDRIVVLYVIT